VSVTVHGAIPESGGEPRLAMPLQGITPHRLEGRRRAGRSLPADLRRRWRAASAATSWSHPQAPDSATPFRRNRCCAYKHHSVPRAVRAQGKAAFVGMRR
jgi:hypothetical protein